MLQGLIDELAGSGIDLRFSRVKTPVMEVMRRTSLAAAIGEDHFYLRESGGVDAYLAEQGLN